MEVAARGFPAAVEAYERSRPGYPAETIRELFARLGLRGPEPILELAAGTGKFTAALIDAGASPVAVEPLPGFREPLRHKFPQVPLVAALAEALPFRSARFDAVMVAQAFHWFDPEPALAEVHRVLRLGGALALVWNVREESHPVHAEMGRLFAQVNPGVPGHRKGRWKEALEAAPGFTAISHFERQFVQEHDVGLIVDRAASVSFVAALPEPEREQLLAELRRAAEADPEIRARGRVGLPYRTDVYWVRTTPR